MMRNMTYRPFLLAASAMTILLAGQSFGAPAGESPVNLALRAKVSVSSTYEPRYAAEKAVDGVVSDDSRWLSRQDASRKWIELDLGQPRALRCAHVYSGWESDSAMEAFSLEYWRDGQWQAIPGARVSGNTSLELAMTFENEVTAQRVRLVSPDRGPVRLRELALFSATQPLGTGVTLQVGQAGSSLPQNRHLVALNQVGYNTAAPKRFTAPVSPDGSTFEIRAVGGAAALFSGVIRDHIGNFSAFQPADQSHEYVVRVSGGTLALGESDPFSIRRHLWEEQFWQTAVDFMIDSRSVVGSHPSAYGGCPWRDGTYYAYEVPSLVLMYLSHPDRVKAMPVQMNWGRDKARVLAPDFKFDANNPHSEGVMDAVRRYYTELEPPNPKAPDIVQLIHWGLGYYLVNPATRDPSRDPLPKQIHSQTVEQFAYLLYAWPELKAWLPQSFHDRCREFVMKHWKSSGVLDIDPEWDMKSYLTPQQIAEPNPTGGRLHPYKGRHAPGHTIQPNLLMHVVARRENRPEEADVYLRAAREHTQWIMDNLDWTDPRTTKGHRMSEQKTMTGLVWFLQHHPENAPPGLQRKIHEWAQVAIQRSANLWDFRRYDLEEHWTIPGLNEPGNLAGFTAAALAAAWVEPDAQTRRRLEEIAFAQMDNLFGRNPRFAAAPHKPEKGFPLVERGWPRGFPDNVCARLETTRGSLSASPGTEMYPFNPGGKFRHPEGWVNFNAAWNVGLAYVRWHELGSGRVRAQQEAK